jgi:hypothetical protein
MQIPSKFISLILTNPCLEFQTLALACSCLLIAHHCITRISPINLVITLKSTFMGLVWWLTLIIPATQQEGIRRIVV